MYCDVSQLDHRQFTCPPSSLPYHTTVVFRISLSCCVCDVVVVGVCVSVIVMSNGACGKYTHVSNASTVCDLMSADHTSNYRLSPIDVRVAPIVY